MLPHEVPVVKFCNRIPVVDIITRPCRWASSRRAVSKPETFKNNLTSLSLKCVDNIRIICFVLNTFCLGVVSPSFLRTAMLTSAMALIFPHNISRTVSVMDSVSCFCCCCCFRASFLAFSSASCFCCRCCSSASFFASSFFAFSSASFFASSFFAFSSASCLARCCSGDRDCCNVRTPGPVDAAMPTTHQSFIEMSPTDASPVNCLNSVYLEILLVPTLCCCCCSVDRFCCNVRTPGPVDVASLAVMPTTHQSFIEMSPTDTFSVNCLNSVYLEISLVPTLCCCCCCCRCCCCCCCCCGGCNGCNVIVPALFVELSSAVMSTTHQPFMVPSPMEPTC